MGRTLLIALELLSASVWIGGLATVAVVAQVARRHLEPAARVAFFRCFGRRYVIVAGCALLIALLCGALLLAGGRWSDEKSMATVVAAALVLATVSGVLQARSLTVLRGRALDGAIDPALSIRIRHRARNAALLRAAIGALTLGLIVLAAVMIS